MTGGAPISLNSSQRGELELLRRIARECLPPAEPALTVPFGDDMAQVPGSSDRLLWTVDLLMDGVHFDSGRHSWRQIGRKALAVNLSDCAAMAASPVGALVGLALSQSLSMEDALEIMRGIRDCGAAYGCPVTGGDTNSWDRPTVVCCAVAARVPPGQRPVTRSGARPGDRIHITGPVGGSILGRHLTFEPRIATALQLARELAPHAMIDVSDGLALDLWRVLEASGVGAEIDEADLERAIHPDARVLSARTGRPPREHALADGEDFELIVVLPEEAPLQRCRELGLLPLGRITAQPGLLLRRADGVCEPLAPRGWEHFR